VDIAEALEHLPTLVTNRAGPKRRALDYLYERRDDTSCLVSPYSQVFVCDLPVVSDFVWRRIGDAEAGRGQEARFVAHLVALLVSNCRGAVLALDRASPAFGGLAGDKALIAMFEKAVAIDGDKSEALGGDLTLASARAIVGLGCSPASIARLFDGRPPERGVVLFAGQSDLAVLAPVKPAVVELKLDLGGGALRGAWWGLAG
jgi:hypothetical protein